MKIVVGPAGNAPSWEWVGEFFVNELKKRNFNVTTFTYRSVPKENCQYFLLVKKPPCNSILNYVKKNRCRLVYCPIDFFETQTLLNQWSVNLSKVDAFLLHCRRLGGFFAKFNKPIFYIEHHLRYLLGQPISYKEDGYVLWAGSFQYVPYLLRWVRKHIIKREIKLVTDIYNVRAFESAKNLSKFLNISFNAKMDARFVDGMEIIPWSEESQRRAMINCKAALDIKGESFGQTHKPATKAQKFISNGIPFAVNSDSYSWEYLKYLGFNVCSPAESTRWWSKSYWEETQIARQAILNDTHPDRIMSHVLNALFLN